MSGAGQHTRASSPACGGRRARGLSGAAKALFNAALAVVVVCFLICQPYTLSFNSWHIEEQKAQAIPAAIPVALEILNGVATAIGVTEVGLALFDGVQMAGSTGYQPYRTDKGALTPNMTELPEVKPTSNWPEWDSLSSTQKTEWVSKENYKAAAINSNLEQLIGDEEYFNLLEQYYRNGGQGDMPEPSEATKTKMGKIKNAAGQLLAGGAVALPAIMQLSNDVSHIFQDAQDKGNLGLSYKREYIKDNIPVRGMLIQASASRNDYFLTSDNWYIYTPYGTAINFVTTKKNNYTLKFDKRTDNGVQYWYCSTSGSDLSWMFSVDNGEFRPGGQYVAGGNVSYPGSNPAYQDCYINLNYSPGYEFPDGTVITPDYVGEGVEVRTDYGQLEETPEDLQKSIIDPVAYNTYISNLNHNAPEGQTWSLTLPEGGITPETDYNDLVQPKPQEQVKDDLDYPSEDPTKPNEKPLDPEEKDLKTRVMNALNAPFAAIFPFCLLDDAKRMFYIFANHGASGEYDYLRFDISGYGISSEQYFTIDLHGLKDLGNTVRWIFNVMLAALLLRAAYRFFVEQSGGD